MENKILKYQLIDWKSLKPFQPKELKKQSKEQLNKIKESFKNNGFKSPFLVWEDKDTIWALDGHTRLLAFELLEADGVDIPKQLPAIW